MANPLQVLQQKFNIDGFVLSILATVVFASFFPASESFAPILKWIVIAGIALLFFLYGARMSPSEAFEGLKHWRLHLTILSFTFVLFPLLGVALRFLQMPIFGFELFSPQMYAGILFLTLVPSTVQSSIAFTSMARGNVAGAIVSASASNLLGVFLTPALVIVMSGLHLMGVGSSIKISGSAILDIVLQLLAPFILGQLARPLIGKWVAEHSKPLRFVDRGSIILVVYSAFSEGVRQGIWHIVGVWQILEVIVLSALIVVLLLCLTQFVSHRLGFNEADTRAVQFCGTKKSLATGLPMAAVLFTGQPIGLIVLPLMIFHQVQLMMCSWLASRYAAQSVDADVDRVSG